MTKSTLLIFLLFPLLLFADTPVIDTVSVGVIRDGYQVRLRSNAEFVYITSMLNDPPRIVIDAQDVKSKVRIGAFQPKDNKFVTRIRCSTFEKEGKKYFRVIVELKSALKYSESMSAEGLTLKISEQGSTPSPVLNKPQPANPTSAGQQAAVIGTEDLVEVTVFDLPQFNVSTRVAADGTITMPLVGSVPVRGLTKPEAEAKIARAMEAKYINNANVSLEIKEYKSKQVSIFGAVKNPGAYYILSNRTLLQLLAEAGGLLTDAGKKCFIFRASSNDRIEISLHQLLNNGDQTLNVPIYPGDVVNIPAETKVIVYVLGEVKIPGMVELSASLPVTLLSAIARAGGLTSDAKQSDIEIRRKSSAGEETVLKANLKDILKGKSPDVTLLAGDIINVPQSFF